MSHSGTVGCMPHHFDAASGLPLTPPARRALDAALAHGWADPSRLYRDGRVSRQLLDAARSAIATSLATLPLNVIVTGSGTQAIHVGLLGLVRDRRKLGTRIVASAVEHSAVLRAADWALDRGEPELIPVDGAGVVDVAAFSDSLRSPGAALAALQYVNHEVGAVQPLEQVHAVARETGVPLLVDACAALGSLPAPIAWDVLVGSAHKWGGPAGVGILVIRPGVRWRSPLPTDESGRWAGFPDVPAVVAAATALENATAELARTSARREQLTALLRREVPRIAEDIVVLGPVAPRAPHIVGFTVLYADGEVLVSELDRAGFSVASGSACTSDTRRPSHILVAMGAVTHGNLRVSLPPDAQERDVVDFLAALPAAVARARASADGRAGS